MMLTIKTRLLKLIVLFFFFTLVVWGIRLIDLPKWMGSGDFQAYWSASYLLSQSQDFSNEDLLFQVQKELAESTNEFVMKTWNPPWVLVWLLPYAALPFRLATKLWLLTNVLFLVLGVVASWQVATIEHQEHHRGSILLVLTTAILFPSTLVAILFGQTNLAVFAGLAGFLWFYLRKQDVMAGFVLTLTMIKPHLVYLALPLIFLYLLTSRRHIVIITFFCVLMLSTFITFLLQPTFFQAYLTSTHQGNLLMWQSPTTTTYLSLVLGIPWIRFTGLLLIPISMIAWYYWKDRIGLVVFTEIAVLASIITAPFGWSYDYVVLLLPMCQIIAWLLLPIISKPKKLFISSLIIIMYGLYYYQRVITSNELYFFWVPLVIAGVYAWLFYARQTWQTRLVVEGKA